MGMFNNITNSIGNLFAGLTRDDNDIIQYGNGAVIKRYQAIVKLGRREDGQRANTAVNQMAAAHPFIAMEVAALSVIPGELKPYLDNKEIPAEAGMLTFVDDETGESVKVPVRVKMDKKIGNGMGGRMQHPAWDIVTSKLKVARNADGFLVMYLDMDVVMPEAGKLSDKRKRADGKFMELRIVKVHTCDLVRLVMNSVDPDDASRNRVSFRPTVPKRKGTVAVSRPTPMSMAQSLAAGKSIAQAQEALQGDELPNV